ncbi:hypothetical protein [Proteiniclasticum sp. QWL-01]|uniref:hypothetical protein n=1 Tax=Proteiniclasticum sp. QWL-01 TaxID=3036945 RepID=UPI0024111049|nr:hypothetical protein [Proteiniclasticum sp. QWL-01]WFF73649.1 hypothetical protein P6M73_04140 [Proteiniclasticum sp. QWL-01]
MTNQDLYNDCKRLYDILVAVSTGENYDNPKLTEEFNRSRRNLIREDFFIDLLPGFVKKYRDLPSFWGFIKNEYKSYSDRRRFLAEQFSPLFDYLEYHEPAAPIEGIVSSAAKMSSDYIHEIWVKALGRRS